MLFIIFKVAKGSSSSSNTCPIIIGNYSLFLTPRLNVFSNEKKPSAGYMLLFRNIKEAI